jgi:hypothetical protein
MYSRQMDLRAHNVSELDCPGAEKVMRLEVVLYIMILCLECYTSDIRCITV